MRKKQIIGWLALCGIVLTGCTTGGSTSDSGSSKSSTKQEFNVVVQQEMPTADLSVATDTISFSALNNVYEGLYRLDSENKPQAAGASELATVSDDGLTYTLKLREDAKWSNGDPVTAADYVYGWQRTVNPKTASEYAYLFESVENATEIINGEKAVDQLGIKATGDYELEIKLTKATPYFQYLLAFPSFFPQNQKEVEKEGDNYAKTSDNAIYNGPFTLEGFDGPGTDTEWSYNKNDQYWDADNVKLDTINVSVVKESSTSLNLFQDGQADDVILSGELAQQMANDKAFVSQEDGRTSYLEYNQRKADSPFKNTKLRQAISYSIDRDALVTNVLGDGSIASTGLIPKNLTFGPDGTEFTKASGTLVSYDADKAKTLWAEAKSELGIDSLSFDIIASDDDSTKKVVEYIQNAIQENLDGITVTVTPVPFSVRLDRSSSGDFDVVMGGWGADYADASSFTDLFVTGNSYNRGQWSNAEYDKLNTAAGSTDVANPEKRWTDLLDAEKVIMDEQGVTPVFQKAEAHLRATKVKDVVVHSAGAQYDYKWAYIEE
ncbi:peptide ABC transporter substrate-binding protein [Enterococcus italicus]|uniref:peptide ABC transporter substrate-binding protein n=1 Tax=Enterococcus italicus TaxID=246144 RepID=UPI0028AEC7A8|nr:peptide ABC transporter substrate-binding protein [Enterococcus italicus]